VTEQMRQRGVNAHSFARYYLEAPGKAGLLLGYGTAGAAELKNGLSRLREALSSAR